RSACTCIFPYTTLFRSLNVPFEEIRELDPGKAIIVKKNGNVSFEQILEPLERKACSFERIYFSRGNDASIYQERKMLGRTMMPIDRKSTRLNSSHVKIS